MVSLSAHSPGKVARCLNLRMCSDGQQTLLVRLLLVIASLGGHCRDLVPHRLPGPICCCPCWCLEHWKIPGSFLAAWSHLPLHLPGWSAGSALAAPAPLWRWLCEKGPSQGVSTFLSKSAHTMSKCPSLGNSAKLKDSCWWMVSDPKDCCVIGFLLFLSSPLVLSLPLLTFSHS